VYLLLGVPLLTFLYQRLDLVPVALAVWGLALARRGRGGGGGGALLGISVLAKLWTAALVPILVLERRRRALAWTVGVSALGMAVWISLSGARGPLQVVSFRGASGWHVESTVGSVLWVLLGGRARMVAGAVRISFAPLW